LLKRRKLFAVGFDHASAVLGDLPSAENGFVGQARIINNDFNGLFWHSRLASFLSDFAPAFSAADRVIVTEVRYHIFPLRFCTLVIQYRFLIK
jgi:hypothetical protein